jgi:hypothetical protein
MTLKSAILAVLGVCILFLGCNNGNSPSPTPGAPSASAASTNQEAVAAKKLKEALDAWVSGDSAKKYENDHADTTAGCNDWSAGKPLTRYEIGMGTKDPGGYRFVVNVFFESESGTDEANSAILLVSPPEKSENQKWAIADAPPTPSKE